MDAPSGWELFSLGVAGAFVSFVVAYLLPELIHYLDDSVRIVPRRIFILVAIMAVMLVVGGLVTVGVDPADTKGAFFTGLGWQGLVKGGSEALSEIAGTRRAPIH